MALACTSTTGIVTDASPRKLVIHGSVTAQLRGSGLSIFVTVSHRFRTPRPVLVPPWTMTPARGRAVSVTSTPCQYWVRAGPKSVSNV